MRLLLNEGRDFEKPFQGILYVLLNLQRGAAPMDISSLGEK